MYWYVSIKILVPCSADVVQCEAHLLISWSKDEAKLKASPALLILNRCVVIIRTENIGTPSFRSTPGCLRDRWKSHFFMGEKQGHMGLQLRPGRVAA